MTLALRELGEDKLLARVFPKLNRNSRVVIGAGDDCAMVKFRGAKDWLLLKADCVVEEIHFARKTSGRAVGWKAMMRALSDFAANDRNIKTRGGAIETAIELAHP